MAKKLQFLDVYANSSQIGLERGFNADSNFCYIIRKDVRIEHLTTDQKVGSSSLPERAKNLSSTYALWCVLNRLSTAWYHHYMSEVLDIFCRECRRILLVNIKL